MQAFEAFRPHPLASHDLWKTSPMTHIDNTALARRWFDEVWNKRRDETVHEILDPDAVGHLEGLVTRGVPGFFQARAYLITAFPDLNVTVEAMLAQGDDVAVRWSVSGTHRGELLGVPATGTPVAFHGITWLRFSNGRIVEGWDAWNQAKLMLELQAAAQGGSSHAS
jgi:steroid delta-isomerase-like uncharacterized protein